MPEATKKLRFGFKFSPPVVGAPLSATMFLMCPQCGGGCVVGDVTRKTDMSVLKCNCVCGERFDGSQINYARDVAFHKFETEVIGSN